MNYEDIEKLVRLVADSGVAEVEVKQGAFQVKVTGTHQSAGAPEVQVLPMPAFGGAPMMPAAAAPVAAAPAAAAPADAAPAAGAADAEDDEDLHVVEASMVGTFYRRPSPDADPFVAEGQVIKKGQVICILEAMKIMNEIEADASGTVVKVFHEEGTPVEYGEPLIALRPL